MNPPLFAHRKHWAHHLLPVPVLPMSADEMDALGWAQCDVILVTGDAYVDHPSFGMALIGRLLEAQGFRVGILAQPDWRDVESFRSLGRPALFFGVTSGNMDSMINRYTADGRKRSDDAYTPDDEAGRRPDRAVIVYANRCREAFPEVPIVLGGVEASLRRVAHYDYWSDKVRRSVLLDAKADLLCYGNAERAVVEIAHRLAAKALVGEIRDVLGTAFVCRAGEHSGPVVRLPSFEEVSSDPEAFLAASKLLQTAAHEQQDDGAVLLQRHGDREVCILPRPAPLSTPEMDRVYELPYTRMPHPVYAGKRLTAHEMIRFSVTILRGCFGGCSFCSLACHEGPIIQSRSEPSILREIERIRDTAEGFSGIISDLGGPTANMYRLDCQHPRGRCQRWSCLFPRICAHLDKSHAPLIRLYRKARALPGIKKILVSSGVRYDLAVCSPEYVRELVQHHVGGYLKIAPEHIAETPLGLMQKPGLQSYERFRTLFDKFSAEAGKEQYLVPYLIAAHPGCSDMDMVEIACWLKKNDLRPDQVQTFLPSPMSLSTAMYHTGLNPLSRGSAAPEEIFVPRGLKTRRLQKAFLRYHDAENWPLLREALQRMEREDLIGNGERHLIPTFQPRGTGLRPEGARTPTQRKPQPRGKPRSKRRQDPLAPRRARPSLPKKR